jgi:hypothetical protein
VREADCAEIRPFLRDENAVVVTTADCFTELSQVSGAAIAKGSALAVYFFSSIDQPKFDRIAGVESARTHAESIKAAVRSAGLSPDPAFDPSARTIDELLLKLRTPSRSDGADVICIIDDASGDQLTRLDSVAGRVPMKLRAVWPVQPNTPNVLYISDARGRQLVFVGASLPLSLVAPRNPRPNNYLDWTRVPSILTLPIQPVNAARPSTGSPQPLLASVKSFFVRGANAANDPAPAPPLKSVVPIVITSRPSSQVRTVVARALLTAPVGGLVDPCSFPSADAYRAFIVGALDTAADDPGGVATDRTIALWEHATLLTTGGFGPEMMDRKADLESTTRKLQEYRKDLVKRLKDSNQQKCVVQGGRYFGNRKLTLYHQGLDDVRNALLNDADPRRPAWLMNAAACLRDAFEQGDVPRCNESPSGLWRDYYAPNTLLVTLAAAQPSLGR